MATILLDTSFIVALNNPRDKNQSPAKGFFSGQRHVYLLPEVVLTETAYLLNRAGGLPASLRFLDRLVATSATLQSVTLVDLKRARGIMAGYPDAPLDFVDCCIKQWTEKILLN